MALPIDGQELSSETEVLRIVRQKSMFIPDGALLPTLEAFRPSADDEKEATKTGKPVRVSVWNKRVTTVQEAKSFRNTQDPLSAFGALVGDLKNVGTLLNEPRVKVVEDPLTVALGSGSQGHCGIEGLDRRSGTSKIRHKELLDAIAQTFSVSC